jgi:predicted HAD superfamily Cof-like phosphohydrolase
VTDEKHTAVLLEAWRAVRHFHEVFALPIAERPQLHVDPSRTARIAWMREEVTEFEEATDIVGQADAMVDLIYFALGTLVEMGVEPSRLFQIVQEANMAKRWPDGLVHRTDAGKVIKPPDWRDPRPEQEREIAAQARGADQTATCLVEGCPRGVAAPYVICGPHFTMLEITFRRSLVAALKRAKHLGKPLPQARLDEALAMIARAEGQTAFDDGRPREPVAGGYQVGPAGSEDESP